MTNPPLETPTVTVTLTCPPITLTTNLTVTITVSYPCTNPQPITLHTSCFKDPWAYKLYRRRGDAREYCAEDDSDDEGFLLVDDIQPVSVGRTSNKFAGLAPGETWTHSFTMPGPGQLLLGPFPRDTVVGDVFEVEFTGAEVDWWNWGREEDHEGTVVKVSMHRIAKVHEPRDNDGRPVIRVEGGAVARFSIQK